MPRVMSTARLSVALLLGALAGCSTHPRLPPPADVDAIPDAVPRAEPRSRYGNPSSYVVFGRRYHVMDSAQGYLEQGVASWYGPKFHGRRTSSGEPYDMYAMTAAHKSLPLPTYVRVTNLDNGRSIVVRVNDRGPFVSNRIIDLSYTAALKLDIVGSGTGLVEVEALTPGRPSRPATRVARAGTEPPVEHTLYIQVGAFALRENAEQLRGQLMLNGFDGVRIERNSGEAVYRVRIGPLASVDSADSTVQDLERIGVMDYRVVID
ncbi:MAG: septal ring lytic transglycosylase RlpA family protein [Chromatiales bacterium]|jgi:rare lipoprotein A